MSLGEAAPMTWRLSHPPWGWRGDSVSWEEPRHPCGVRPPRGAHLEDGVCAPVGTHLRAALHGHLQGCAHQWGPIPGPPGSRGFQNPGPSAYSLTSCRVVSSSCVVRVSRAPRDAIRKCASLNSRTWSRLCFRVTGRTSCHRSPTDTPKDMGRKPTASWQAPAPGPLHLHPEEAPRVLSR